MIRMSFLIAFIAIIVCLLPFSISYASQKETIFEAKCYSSDGHIIFDKLISNPEYTNDFITFIEPKTKYRDFIFADCDLIKKS